MKKFIGYIVVVVGFIVLLLGLGYLSGIGKVVGQNNSAGEAISDLETESGEINANFGSSAVSIIGGVILLVGIFIVLRSTKAPKKAEQVPIFDGSKIIGYRQH